MGIWLRWEQASAVFQGMMKDHELVYSAKTGSSGEDIGVYTVGGPFGDDDGVGVLEIFLL